VSQHGRKYGEKESRPIPVWNGILDHRRRIGSSVWVFLWLLDKITKECDGVGVVWDGRPATAGRIAQDLGWSEKTVRSHLDRLEANGYIDRKLAPYGFVIRVLKSHKFGIWRSHQRSEKSSQPVASEAGTGLPTTWQSSSEPSEENIQPKRDAATNAALDAADCPASALEDLTSWKALGSDLPMGTPRFQNIYQHYFSTRNGNPLSDAMERAIQRANKDGVRVPKPFFDAKRVVERREVEAIASFMEESEGLKELEDLPWHKH
jgi:hypothetical protein